VILGPSADMPATIVVGRRWGEEGKGKATDLLAGFERHLAHDVIAAAGDA